MFGWLRKKLGGTLLMVTGGGSYGTRVSGADAYAREGYALCSIVMRCVSLVSRSLASAPLIVWVGDDEADDKHPLVQLLRRPNPMQSGAQLLENLCAFNRLMGNSFVEMIGPDNGEPNELWCWPAQKMEVLKGETRMPAGYRWRDGTAVKTWDVDFTTGTSSMMHWKTFNPIDSMIGMAPLSAAAYEVDQHNAAGKWNYNLLRNAAVPKGALKVEGTLTPDQRRQLREQLEERYEGADNARRGMILEGGLDWKDIGLSPQEMDWLNGRHDAARCIASVFGVPEQMVPIPGAQTFANYKEARLSLWEDTVLPLLDEFLEQMNVWLAPSFGDDVRIGYDRDRMGALEPRRQERWSSVMSANWLTINEKREATGYGPFELDATQGSAGSIWLPAGLVPIDEAVPSDPGEGVDPDGTILPIDLQPTEDVAHTALSGAQVQSLAAIVQSVADGQLPAESAVRVILAAFPSLAQTDAEAMVSPADGFSPRADGGAA